MLNASQLFINSILLAIQHRKEKVQEPTTHCQHCLFFVSYQANYACASSQQRRKLKRGLLSFGCGHSGRTAAHARSFRTVENASGLPVCRMRLLRVLMRPYSKTTIVDEKAVGAAAFGGTPARPQWLGRPVSR